MEHSIDRGRWQESNFALNRDAGNVEHDCSRILCPLQKQTEIAGYCINSINDATTCRIAVLCVMD